MDNPRKKKPHVLVVEDDLATANLTTLMLRTAFDVTERHDGKEAIEFLLSTLAGEAPEVDVVSLNINMPVMNGFEALRWIREHPHFHSLPVFMLSGSRLKGARATEFGANAFVSKPFERDQLVNLINSLLDDPKSTKQG